MCTVTQRGAFVSGTLAEVPMDTHLCVLVLHIRTCTSLSTHLSHPYCVPGMHVLSIPTPGSCACTDLLPLISDTYRLSSVHVPRRADRWTPVCVSQTQELFPSSSWTLSPVHAYLFDGHM